MSQVLKVVSVGLALACMAPAQLPFPFEVVGQEFRTQSGPQSLSQHIGCFAQGSDSVTAGAFGNAIRLGHELNVFTVGKDWSGSSLLLPGSGAYYLTMSWLTMSEHTLPHAPAGYDRLVSDPEVMLAAHYMHVNTHSAVWAYSQPPTQNAWEAATWLVPVPPVPALAGSILSMQAIRLEGSTLYASGEAVVEIAL